MLLTHFSFAMLLVFTIVANKTDYISDNNEEIKVFSFTPLPLASVVENPDLLIELRDNYFLNDDRYVEFIKTETEVLLGECNNLDKVIRLGNYYMQKPEPDCQLIGDIMLSSSADKLEQLIASGTLNRKKPEIANMITILSQNSYHIRIDLSDWEKLNMHIKSGNWGYIIRKIGSRSQRFLPMIYSALVISLLTVIILLVRKYVKLNPTLMTRFTSLFTLMLIFSSFASAQLNEKSYASSWNNEVVINKLYSGGSEIGQSIYLSRSNKRIKAKYFAGSLDGLTVYQRYEQWKRDRDIILCCSGAYTTSESYDTPLGLTIDYGRLINRKVDQTMDALVIIEFVGGIRIYDLDQGQNLSLVSLGSKVDPRNDSGKQQFISWAATENATVFQTNLLYYSNSAKHGDMPATAERRMLAVVERYGEGVSHILFNVERSVSLTDLAAAIFDLLNYNGYSVVGLINLDTGAMNAFEAYLSNGRTLPFKGSTPISDASNLIVYYYE